MIGQAKWFTRRKYTGWGLMPRTWQGIAYVVVVAGLIAFLLGLQIDPTIKLVATSVLAILVVFDVLSVMASMKLDEREQKNEAIAERNASWVMVASIALSILYVTTLGKELRGEELMPVLILPIALGAIVKALTHFILDRTGV